MYTGKQKLAWASGYWKGVQDTQDVLMNYDFFPAGLWDDLDKVMVGADRKLRESRAAAEAEAEANSQKEMQLLYHILKNIYQVDTLICMKNVSEPVFKRDFFYRNAISMSLFWIVECVRDFSSDFRQENTQIPWSEIAGYDILAYNRNEPEFDTLWRIASEDMPKLRAFCEQKLKERNVPFPEPESLEEAPSPSEG